MLPGESLNAAPLSRPDAVVGLRGDVFHAQNLEPGGLQRADRRLTARARALDEDLDLLEAVVHALAGAGVCGHLRGERRRLARALEPGRAGGLPRDHVSVVVGERDDRVVERRLDVRLADRDVLLDAAARATTGRWFARRCHQRSPAVARVLVARETPASQGRRERSYPEDTGATEDAARRRVGAPRRVRGTR